MLEAVQTGVIRTDRTAEGEVHLGSTRAVAHSDCTSERDKITGCDIVLLDEGLLQLDDLVETDVGVERRLDGVEGHDGAVSTPAAGSVVSLWSTTKIYLVHTRTGPELRGQERSRWRRGRH